jgi:hypothetical protein
VPSKITLPSDDEFDPDHWEVLASLPPMNALRKPGGR